MINDPGEQEDQDGQPDHLRMELGDHREGGLLISLAGAFLLAERSREAADSEDAAGFCGRAPERPPWKREEPGNTAQENRDDGFPRKIAPLSSSRASM